MNSFQFTEEQISNLNTWKKSLTSEKAQGWAAQEDKAEAATSAILNDEKFKNGEDLGPEKLDELFRNMKWFSANRNLSNLLYRDNGIEKFNGELRALIHGTAPLPERVNNFFKLGRIGIQTMSQFLIAANTREHAFVTSQTKEALGVSSEQDENALADALDMFRVPDKDAFLDRTLDYLRDYVIFRGIKTLLNLDKYTHVNNLLWFAAIQEEPTGPEDVIKSYGSISMENDLRDFLADNLFLIEKGLTLVGKEYDTRGAGRIDLLCQDKRGYHVVIELKKGRIGHEVVGQTLKYIGWVQENLSQKARGIIVVNEPDEKLRYAALPLKDLVCVKYYKVNFSLSDKFPVEVPMKAKA